MKEPQHFQKAFVGAMTVVALILAGFSAICVLAFGYVTNGSVTAFLLETFRDDPKLTFWVMIGNAAVSLSVLLTYPLQLFPALELLAPTVSKYLPFGYASSPSPEGGEGGDDDDDDGLLAFEPLPPLPEHGFPSLDSLPPMEHHYEVDNDEEKSDEDVANGSIGMSKSAISSMVSVMPEFTMVGDSFPLRTILVLWTFIVAVAVPNVQALISLAGALAGSSTALLIPPVLELAWIRHIEVDLPIEEAREEERRWLQTGNLTKQGWFWEKIKCYVSLALGLLFMLIGTYASLADIIRIYTSGSWLR